jgi:hypothetical protein
VNASAASPRRSNAVGDGGVVPTVLTAGEFTNRVMATIETAPPPTPTRTFLCAVRSSAARDAVAALWVAWHLGTVRRWHIAPRVRARSFALVLAVAAVLGTGSLAAAAAVRVVAPPLIERAPVAAPVPSGVYDHDPVTNGQTATDDPGRVNGGSQAPSIVDQPDKNRHGGDGGNGVHQADLADQGDGAMNDVHQPNETDAAGDASSGADQPDRTEPAVRTPHATPHPEQTDDADPPSNAGNEPQPTGNGAFSAPSADSGGSGG